MSTVVARALAAAVVLAGLPASAQQVRLDERVDVARLIVDVRVLDRSGQPMTDLAAEHFEVSLRGRKVRVESVQWIGAEQVPDGDSDRAPDSEAPAGRLVVLLFQRDLEPSRMAGLLELRPRALKLAEGFGLSDRVAVLSFDKHLKIWTDFTADRSGLRAAIDRAVMGSRPVPLAASPPPSLLAGLDPGAAQRTRSEERALLMIAQALEPLPGAKSLVLFGWGFGEMSRAGVHLGRDYEKARIVLNEARVSVFSVDVTRADYHTLELGLQDVAAATGGLYERTYTFPGSAMKRLDSALAGHYVLIVERPSDWRAGDGVKVELVGRKGTVLTSPQS